MSESDKVVKVKDYTKFPGPRFIKLGPYSGEWFRKDVLFPKVQQYGDELIVNLDGTLGYGSSFLDESFAGLVRQGVDKDVVLKIVGNVVCNDDPELKNEIMLYVNEEING